MAEANRPLPERALALPELEGGLVPYIEMFRLIREHQYDLAAGLYVAYGEQFAACDLRDLVFHYGLKNKKWVCLCRC